ncbi:MAG: hypothetical protein RR370_02605 [Synergistaceae bacterium]
MLTVNNKFVMNEEVYSIWNIPMKNACDMCNGIGAIDYQNKKLRCPKCKGEKILIDKTYRHWEVMPDKLKIDKIKVLVAEGCTTIKYKASKYNRGEKNLFKTVEEAQTQCDKLNHVIEEQLEDTLIFEMVEIRENSDNGEKYSIEDLEKMIQVEM